MGENVKSLRDENFTRTKDGHTDVASTQRMCRLIIEDAQDILNALPSDMEASLPTWWPNKLATSSAYVNSARDYLVYMNADMPVSNDEMMEQISENMNDDDDDDMIPPSFKMVKSESSDAS